MSRAIASVSVACNMYVCIEYPNISGPVTCHDGRIIFLRPAGVGFTTEVCALNDEMYERRDDIVVEGELEQ
jgi:hypothetical protein